MFQLKSDYELLMTHYPYKVKDNCVSVTAILLFIFKTEFKTEDAQVIMQCKILITVYII